MRVQRPEFRVGARLRAHPDPTRSGNETKSPAVLTVNGRAAFVVQDALSYQGLLDKVAAAEDLEAIREGLAQSLAGQGRPASEFFAQFEAQHGLVSEPE